MDTELQVVKATPIIFDVTVNAVDIRVINAWIRSLRERHSCIERIHFVTGYLLEGRLPRVATVRLTLHEDADYRQICALRAELKS